MVIAQWRALTLQDAAEPAPQPDTAATAAL